MTNKITVIAVDGQQQDVEFDQGDSLMEVLRDAGYDEIMAICGGCCSCATCHVKIANQDAYQLPPVEEDEEVLLSLVDAYELDSSRLSCQITMGEAQQGMTVTVVEAD
ncbi:MAG: 2Fe-2S ferredoxin [Arenicella sp.]|jgi:2Fe-2S ferredoxin